MKNKDFTGACFTPEFTGGGKSAFKEGIKHQLA
jgi:hypothetical protein